MTHLSEEDLILIYYGEAGISDDTRLHLAGCPECEAAAASLAHSLSACNEGTAPEQPLTFGRDVWIRLAPQLADLPREGRRRHGLRLWAAALGFAVLLIAVFLAGRYSRRFDPALQPAPVMAGLSDQARQRILAIAVADHLDRVQILMTEIRNTSDAKPEALFADRDRAEDLVQEGRLIRQSLESQGQSSTTGFLDDVERFLTEAAHLPDDASPREIRALRDRIEAGSLLFKVRIVEQNLRNEEQYL